jgi:hypothetical protein
MSPNEEDMSKKHGDMPHNIQTHSQNEEKG